MRPIHPGEHSREDYLVPLGLSANRLARALGIPANRITEILAGRRAITADTALRLARFFDTSSEYWLSWQKTYEPSKAEIDVGPALEQIKPLARTA